MAVVLTLFMALPSCKPKETEVEAAFLKLSQKQLELKASADEVSVTVTTNQSTWVATSPDNGKWIELSTSNDKITIKTKANEMAEPRKSYVLVNAGSATEAIEITQAAATLTLDVLPKSITVPQAGGTYSIDIYTNHHWDLDIQPKVDWIEVRSNTKGNIVTLKVSPNNDERDREAQLIVYSQDKKKGIEVPIIQESFPKYTLPLWGQTVESVMTLIEYEHKMGNHFNRHLPADPSDPYHLYYFFPRKGFAERIYRVDEVTNLIEEVIDSTPKTDIIESDFIPYLLETGFTEIDRSEKKWTGENKALEMAITIEKRSRSTVIYYRKVMTQKSQHPTFESLPEDVLFAFIDDKTADIEKIKQAEIAAGSTNFETFTNPEGSYAGQVYLMLCNVAASKKPHVKNGYSFRWDKESQGSLSEKLTVYEKLELAFWTDPTTKKKYPTKEILELMKKEGWKQVITDEEEAIYFTKNDKILSFRTYEFADINNGQTVLLVNGGIQQPSAASIARVAKTPHSLTILR